MKFDRRIFSNLLLFVLLIVVTAVITMCSSSSAIKVAFSDDIMAISAVGYGMNIAYEDVKSLELTEALDLGSVADGKNKPELKSGIWENNIWGEYYLCFNPQATSCIVVHLKDGRTCVFNNNTNEQTAESYQEFLSHLPSDVATK